MKIYHSFSSEETKKFGAEIAKQFSSCNFQFSKKGRKTALVPRRRLARDKCALILALRGDLGAGKTTFTQGFLKGLGVRRRVSSPTFVLMKRFTLRNLPFANVYHIDCYRVKKSAELSSLGLKEIFENPENLVLVEWPERLGRILPKRRLNLVFRHGKDEEVRAIKVI